MSNWTATIVYSDNSIKVLSGTTPSSDQTSTDEIGDLIYDAMYRHHSIPAASPPFTITIQIV